MTLYALLVGIDAYAPPVRPLRGCRNDVDALAQYLRARTDVALELEVRHDEEATRQAVIDALRGHLGRAGPGDVALFAYAGHGSEEAAPAEIADLEPSGRIQTLMLFDCNRRVGGKLVRALADKELAVLLGEIAAGGAHVAVVLDCCHSGGATRDVSSAVRGWSPWLERDVGEPGLVTPRPLEDFVPGALEQWRAATVPHVALSACRSHETARESDVDGATRGTFSIALLDALSVLGTRTTYRTLLDTLRARVERTTAAQRPELFPLQRGGLGDALFLDGTVSPVPAAFTVTRAGDGCIVDAGSVHGMRPPSGDEAFVLACTAPDGAPAGRARVTDVGIGTSRVEPIDWAPADVAYAAVIAEVPLPLAEVVVEETTPPDAGAATAAAVRDAVATAGPDGGPSPSVRVVDAPSPSVERVELRVRTPRAGTAQLCTVDGAPIGPPVPLEGGGARLVAARLEHVARWEQVRHLGEHASPLADAVRLDLYDAEPGEEVRPPDRLPRPAAGGHDLAYRRDDGTLHAPHVYIDVTNQSADELHVAVLDLTDRYRCHVLLPTVRLAAGHTLSLWDRRPLPVELPAGRALEPGATARDWLRVIVSDVDFDATTAELPALDEPVTRSASLRPPRTTLERLFARAARRDVGGAPPDVDVARWAATTVALEVTVP